MAEAVHYLRLACDCARRAKETSDQEEHNLLCEMSGAWMKLAHVEADVAKQAAAEWTLDTLH